MTFCLRFRMFTNGCKNFELVEGHFYLVIDW